ncbi:MAG: aminopeptidase [Saprospiraceae bacterium]|nr:aminopeptidase [Saprospiraceae bacterium]
MRKKIAPVVFAISLLGGAMQTYAQVDLINKVKDNASENTVGFKWETVVDLNKTPIKSQGNSGTCWSYCSNSFVESEMLRLGKDPVDLAEMYTVRNTYLEKADRYVRLHGNFNFGQGGALHDVLDMIKKYGAIPQEAYQGLNYGSTTNKHDEMESMLKSILDVVAKKENGEISPVWKVAYTKVLETYLGEAPKEFDYKGKKYTPQAFAKDYMGINPDDYIEFTSQLGDPFYSKTIVLVPDNWTFAASYNLPINEMTDVIDYALKKGYSVSWASDVSEKYFSWKNGVAYVPAKPYAEMSDDERKAMFAEPKEEMKVTQEMRQNAYDNFATTDDHGMHIVGIVKDQNGKEYYKVKNSWGEANDQKGFINVSKEFLKFKTTSFLLHKDGVPPMLRKKIGV